MLWLKTSGLASNTFLYASPFLKKSGVKTSIVVLGFVFLVWFITWKKWFDPPSFKSSLSTDVMTTCFKLNFLTAWVIIFPNNNIVEKVLKSLPKKPSHLEN